MMIMTVLFAAVRSFETVMMSFYGVISMSAFASMRITFLSRIFISAATFSMIAMRTDFFPLKTMLRYYDLFLQKTSFIIRTANEVITPITVTVNTINEITVFNSLFFIKKKVNFVLDILLCFCTVYS